MMDLMPKETLYKGYRFRSRLEARWAVFYDALHIPYIYEPEGYNLNGTGYLPDFWLPDQQCFIEIKPNQEEAEKGGEKAWRLAEASGFEVYIFWKMGFEHGFGESAWAYFPDGGEDYNYQWCMCQTCGAMGIEFEGRTDRLPCRSGGRCPRSPHGDKGYAFDVPLLQLAYLAARQARFEYGEVGSPIAILRQIQQLRQSYRSAAS